MIEYLLAPPLVGAFVAGFAHKIKHQHDPPRARVLSTEVVEPDDDPYSQEDVEASYFLFDEMMEREGG